VLRCVAVFAVYCSELSPNFLTRRKDEMRREDVLQCLAVCCSVFAVCCSQSSPYFVTFREYTSRMQVKNMMCVCVCVNVCVACVCVRVCVFEYVCV